MAGDLSTLMDLNGGAGGSYGTGSDSSSPFDTFSGYGDLGSVQDQIDRDRLQGSSMFIDPNHPPAGGSYIDLNHPSGFNINDFVNTPGFDQFSKTDVHSPFSYTRDPNDLFRAGPGNMYGDYVSGGGINATGNGFDLKEMDPSQKSWVDDFRDFLHSKTGRLGSMALSLFVPGAAPFIAAGNLGADLATGHGAQGLLGLAGGMVGGMAGWGSNLGTQLSSMAGFSPSSLGSYTGSQLDNGNWSGAGGFNTGIGLGAGATLGSMFGNGASPTGSVGGLSGDRMMGDISGLDNLGAGLGSMYMANRYGSGLNSQINGLTGLYGPNSAYATQLKQQLAAQDAAAGRNSQYGTRAVELQARLADAASRTAPTLANLYQQRNNADMMKYAAMFQMARGAGLTNPDNYKRWFGDTSIPGGDSVGDLYSGNQGAFQYSPGTGFDYNGMMGGFSDPGQYSQGTGFDLSSMFGGGVGPGG